jgi:hypothetical protein
LLGEVVEVLGLLEKNARSAIPSMLLKGIKPLSVKPPFLLLLLSPVMLNELMGVSPSMDWEESHGKSKSFLAL